jgi:hypothetical protein
MCITQSQRPQPFAETLKNQAEGTGLSLATAVNQCTALIYSGKRKSDKNLRASHQSSQLITNSHDLSS